jgi:hypothetical protein
VTVILLIVGHRPVFQPGHDRDLLAVREHSRRSLRTNRDLGSSVRLHTRSGQRGNVVKKGLSPGPAAVAGYGKAPDGADVPTAWPLRSAVVITAAAILTLALRLFQLSRPGYLSGFTQYDDGVYFGRTACRFRASFFVAEPPYSEAFKH